MEIETVKQMSEPKWIEVKINISFIHYSRAPLHRWPNGLAEASNISQVFHEESNNGRLRELHSKDDIRVFVPIVLKHFAILTHVQRFSNVRSVFFPLNQKRLCVMKKFSAWST